MGKSNTVKTQCSFDAVDIQDMHAKGTQLTVEETPPIRMGSISVVVVFSSFFDFFSGGPGGLSPPRFPPPVPDMVPYHCREVDRLDLARHWCNWKRRLSGENGLLPKDARTTKWGKLLNHSVLGENSTLLAAKSFDNACLWTIWYMQSRLALHTGNL